MEGNGQVMQEGSERWAERAVQGRRQVVRWKEKKGRAWPADVCEHVLGCSPLNLIRSTSLSPTTGHIHLLLLSSCASLGRPPGELD